MFTNNEWADGKYAGYNPAFARKVRERRRAEELEHRKRERQAALKKATAKPVVPKTLPKPDPEYTAEYRMILNEPMSCRGIIAAIAIDHGVTYQDIVGVRRSRPLVVARDAAVRAVADARPALSLPAIGRIFGDRDHTTILHSLKKTRKPGQAR